MFDRFLFHGHLEEGESVVKIIHRHWLSAVMGLFWPTLCFATSLGLLYFAHSRRPLLIGVVIGSFIILLWWIRNFLDYYLDAWIVTDHGIIDVQWHGFFHRESARILYSDLHGVSYEIKGVTATIFRFGTVEAEKISTGAAVTMEQVPRPRAVEALILRKMEAYLHSKNLKNAKHVQEMLAELVAERLQLESMSPDS